jgi:hypothetical protein
MQSFSRGPVSDHSPKDNIGSGEAAEIQGAANEKRCTQTDGEALAENALTKAARSMGIAWVAE